MARRVAFHRSSAEANARRAYTQSASRRADQCFYASAAWKRLRNARLAEHPLCEDCSDEGLTTAAEQVHHIVKRKDNADLALDYDNLRSLCHRCHSERTGRGE